jgi:hypothetical protein
MSKIATRLLLLLYVIWLEKVEEWHYAKHEQADKYYHRRSVMRRGHQGKYLARSVQHKEKLLIAQATRDSIRRRMRYGRA